MDYAYFTDDRDGGHEYTDNVEEMAIKINLKSLFVKLYAVRDTPNVFLMDRFEIRLKGITNATQEAIWSVTDDMKHFFLAIDWESIQHYRQNHQYMWDSSDEEDNEDANEEEE